MSLPHAYRFKIENQSTVTITSGLVEVFARRYKFDSNGALTYEGAEAEVYRNNADITDGSFLAGAAHLNATSGWIGGSFLMASSPNSSPAGNVNLYLERSTDEGTDFDVDGLGTLVATIPFSHATDLVSRGLSFDL